MNLCNRLIRLFGGHTAAELAEVRAEQERQRKTLAHYQDFTKAISLYAGNYPAWKAPRDYRATLQALGHPLTDRHLAPDHDHLTKAEYVDRYLVRIADSFDALRQHIPEAVPGHWDSYAAVRGEPLPPVAEDSPPDTSDPIEGSPITPERDRRNRQLIAGDAFGNTATREALLRPDATPQQRAQYVKAMIRQWGISILVVTLALGWAVLHSAR
ncbi:hypothetical protein KAM448_36630 [Aeromonas caviae]|uniref:Uncharacterized protein n=1 Tax=Aeromonas caviae TaxID=648 RepID=A0ABD0B981_AERCA|nr:MULTISPECIES: hypothetical protein [Aeromonas]BCK65854.1 hypothetical protein KAM330_48430 [Aeromonas hydrophila]BCR31445.1 hypothetical protein KAM376_44510 [Aeromonas caviae]GJA71891.1 hypothetical protein KAM353_15380 [Aeromonas caviae]GJA81640.1 hypothetical protein KAM355_22000 [Aeromonas caviae]GJB00132.1 hypothetical protein KAM359_35390 [Aeromonas caviae]